MAETPVRHDLPRRLRQSVGPWLDRLGEAIGEPTTHVYPSGYVGTVSLPIAELEAELGDGGFDWDPVSMYHYTPEGSPPDGSWAYRPSWLADRQIHVVLYGQGSRTEVYAHDEFSWLRHPVKHAMHVDIRRREGVAEVRRWLDRRGLEYDRDSRIRRTIRHLAGRIRESGLSSGDPAR